MRHLSYFPYCDRVKIGVPTWPAKGHASTVDKRLLKDMSSLPRLSPMLGVWLQEINSMFK